MYLNARWTKIIFSMRMSSGSHKMQTKVYFSGLNKIGLAPPSSLKAGAQTGAFTQADINEVIKGMRNAKGFGFDAKVRKVYLRVVFFFA